MTIQKIKDIHDEALENLSEFERGFITDNFERVEKFGENTRFSAKQVALVDRIYKERVEENKPAKQKSAADSIKVGSADEDLPV